MNKLDIKPTLNSVKHILQHDDFDLAILTHGSEIKIELLSWKAFGKKVLRSHVVSSDENISREVGKLAVSIAKEERGEDTVITGYVEREETKC